MDLSNVNLKELSSYLVILIIVLKFFPRVWGDVVTRFDKSSERFDQVLEQMSKQHISMIESANTRHENMIKEHRQSNDQLIASYVDEGRQERAACDERNQQLLLRLNEYHTETLRNMGMLECSPVQTLLKEHQAVKELGR